MPIARRLESRGEDAAIAGMLHDIVEDTPVTLEDLRDLGVSPAVVSAIDSVTGRDGEPYDGLIARACADPLGVHVKLADNTHNLESLAGLADQDPETALLLQEKYRKAREALRLAIETLDGPSDAAQA